MQRKTPTKAELVAAMNKSVPDVIAPGLNVLFCGINPGLYTAAVQEHFGRPGNKFWKALYLSGFTPKLFHPSEQYKLLDLKLGITNLVNRATVSQTDVSANEFIKGGELLTKKIKKYRPEWIAFVGIDAFRTAFTKKAVTVGNQENLIGQTNIWILPSTSGLNAHYTLDKTVKLFKELKKAVELNRNNTH